MSSTKPVLALVRPGEPGSPDAALAAIEDATRMAARLRAAGDAAVELALDDGDALVYRLASVRAIPLISVGVADRFGRIATILKAELDGVRALRLRERRP